MIEDYNSSHRRQFADLPHLIRYQLGGLLEDAGTGFLVPRNAEMMGVGERMKEGK
jgi:hypothetical protein